MLPRVYLIFVYAVVGVLGCEINSEPGVNGSSCTVVENADGSATIRCDDGREATIGLRGERGPQGPPGPAGPKGDPGESRLAGGQAATTGGTAPESPGGGRASMQPGVVSAGGDAEAMDDQSMSQVSAGGAGGRPTGGSAGGEAADSMDGGMAGRSTDGPDTSGGSTGGAAGGAPVGGR
ncbi:MAG: hypothetical protein VX589_13590 [Myxococcota bacterium]|nr:hypothetical protein [Myxococcota bacterium]